MMYVVLIVSKDSEMVSSLKDDIKKQFPSIRFTTQEAEGQGTQLRLEGTADESKPRMFALGYEAAWNLKDKTK